MNQAKEQFMFDLQLFNDGEPAPTAEPAPQDTPPVEAPADSQATPPPAAPAEPDYSELGKSKNPQDQLAFLRQHGFIDKSDAQPPTAPAEPPKAETPPVETPATEPEFEIKVNGTVKKVKQSELLELAQKGFDYTQKTQELADQRRSLDILAQQQKVNAVQQPPQPPPAKQAEQEYRAALAQVERNLGVDPGGFNEFDRIHQFELNRVIADMNSQKAAHYQVENRLNTFVQAARQDPISQQVDANFDSYMYKLGAESPEGAQKAQAVMAAKQKFLTGNASMADLDVLESHWNYVKTALSAPPVPPKPIPVVPPKTVVEPPKTEAPGNSVTPPPQSFNYKSLGKMKQKDQINALKKIGILKRG